MGVLTAHGASSTLNSLNIDHSLILSSVFLRCHVEYVANKVFTVLSESDFWSTRRHVASKAGHVTDDVGEDFIFWPEEGVLFVFF